MSKNVKQFRGDVWFDRHVEERTRKALKEKEARFAAEHAKDTDDELLEYLRQFSAELGFTPAPGEIIGGSYIFKRFGNWETACRRAGLPCGRVQAADMKKRYIYKREFEEQAKLFKQSRRDGTDSAVMERQAKKEAALIRENERRERDKIWWQSHHQDSDEALLEHVRSCCNALGKVPRVADVPGADFIISRFGNWTTVLARANMPVPSK